MMELDLDFILETMKKYMAIPSPAGFTHEAIKVADEEFKSMGIAVKYTKKGALIATLEGDNDDEHVMISAHIDTLGGMVKDITSDGKLKYHRIGGGCWNAVEGENCNVFTAEGRKIRGSILPRQASSHTYGLEAYEARRDEKNMLVRLDEKVTNQQDVLDLGINIGDFIAMDTRTEITESGFVKSRYLDNKVAVAVVFGICKYFKEHNLKPKYTTHFCISNYEEVGHGVSYIPEKTKEMIAIDIGTVAQGQQSDEYSVSIAAKDKKTPYDFVFRNKLVNLAKEHNIGYKVDVYNHYASDATQAIARGADVNFACLGPGVDATHHYERCHIEAIENTAKILVAYMLAE